MKKIVTIGLYLAGGVFLLKLVKSYGYMEGAMDVLDQYSLDSFTKEYKSGASVTYNSRNKQKGEDK